MKHDKIDTHDVQLHVKVVLVVLLHGEKRIINLIFLVDLIIAYVTYETGSASSSTSILGRWLIGTHELRSLKDRATTSKVELTKKENTSSQMAAGV
ncbi:Protein of unknown function [Gryllus bimaculatus]|nr:Protein of unknown function [Gryllus bimaculatus]